MRYDTPCSDPAESLWYFRLGMLPTRNLPANRGMVGGLFCLLVRCSTVGCGCQRVRCRPKPCPNSRFDVKCPLVASARCTTQAEYEAERCACAARTNGCVAVRAFAAPRFASLLRGGKLVERKTGTSRSLADAMLSYDLLRTRVVGSRRARRWAQLRRCYEPRLRLWLWSMDLGQRPSHVWSVCSRWLANVLLVSVE